MINQVMLVGRVAEIKKKESEDTFFCTITISCQRLYKNSEGNYENDLIDVVLCGAYSKRMIDDISKGDLIGIKGRTETNYNEDGSRNNVIKGEKVIFLPKASENSGE